MAGGDSASAASTERHRQRAVQVATAKRRNYLAMLREEKRKRVDVEAALDQLAKERRLKKQNDEDRAGAGGGCAGDHAADV